MNRIVRISTAMVVALAMCFVLLMGAAQGAPGAVSPKPKSSVAIPHQLLAQVAAKVPEFGGMYYDQNTNSLAIYLTDVKQKAAAEKAIAAVLGQGRIPAGGTRAVQGQHTFSELLSWYQTLTSEVWQIPGVVSTSLNEGKNRILIGVKDQGDVDTVRQLLVTLNLPKTAFIITVTGPGVDATTLSQKASSLQGGLRITYYNSVTSSYYICSIGAPAKFGSSLGFLTASHCSGQPGVLDGTVFAQANFPDRVGTKSIDPAPFTGGACPITETCRWSDSQFVVADTGVNTSLGYIARPDGTGSTDAWNISTQVPQLRIVGTYTPLVGETVNMVGATSGIKVTTVSDTCVTVRFTPGITHLCQMRTATIVDAGGDSGGTWFSWINGSSTDVNLVGTHKGHDTGSVFSRIDQIKTELNPSNVCASGYSC